MRAEVIHVWFCIKGTAEGTKVRGISDADVLPRNFNQERVLKHDAL